MISLADILSYLDSRKRVLGSNLRDLATNPGETAERLFNAPEDRAERQRGTLLAQRRLRSGGGLLGGSVMPGVDKITDTPEFSAAMNAPMGLLGWTAYHGSPHKFDKFRLDKIGTGEGAQAYGHGLYFGDLKETAQTYKMAGKSGYLGAQSQRIAAEALNAAGGHKQAALSKLHEMALAAPPAQRQPYWDAMNNFDELTTKSGHLYKVDIDDARAPKDAFLDWDKPLSEQGAVGKKVAQRFGFDPGQYTGQAAVAQIPQHAMVERQMYEKMLADARKYDPRPEKIAAIVAKLRQLENPQAFASETLRELGIPGIRYLDAGSRGSGGTYNTVLFDDSLVKILERQ